MNKKEENHDKNKEELQQEPDKANIAAKQNSGKACTEELLRKKEEEYNQLWDKYLRTCADFENIRKRLEKERQDTVRFANEEIVSELLNVLDDLERTVSLAEDKHQDLSTFLKGVEMVLAHLYEMLKRYGVKPIESEGKLFDPHLHEALMQVENNDLPEHTVVEELQKGYLLNDRVIRTAKVATAKRAKDTQRPQKETENK